MSDSLFVNSRSTTDIERSQRLETAYDELMNDDNDFDEMLIQNDTTIAVQQTEGTNRNQCLSKTGNVTGVNSLRTINARGDNSARNVRSNSPVAGCSKSSDESPVIPVLGAKVKVSFTSPSDYKEFYRFSCLSSNSECSFLT